MRVLIVEEALKSLHGHWFQYISDIVNGGVEAGHEIEVAVHKDACAEILKALPCRPILNSTVFEKETVPAGKYGSVKRILCHNRSLYRDLSAFLAGGKVYDLIIATTPRLDHLLAYELLQWRFRHQIKQQWVLVFIEAVGKYSPDYSILKFSTKSLPLKYAMKLSRLLPGSNRFSLVTESEGLAHQFKKFCGIEFPLVPHVTHLPKLDLYRNKSPLSPSATIRPLVLGTFGFTRFDKGVDILQSAIKRLPAPTSQRDFEFVIQWTGDYRLPDGTWVRKDPTLESSRFVQYIPNFSASNEYYEWIARTDIMVLPYRKAFYYDKLSRVAIDAALAGMPIVYPAGTWLESFVAQHGAGASFQPDDPASLTKAIQEVLASYQALKALAESRKQSTSEAFSANTFFTIIADLPNPKLQNKNHSLKLFGETKSKGGQKAVTSTSEE